MSIIQISKIQVRSGNIDQLPQLSVGEFGWATDTYQLFIGNDPNVIGPHPDNTEVLTQYSTIDINAAGYDTDVQYNENGALAGSNNFTWTNGTSTLTVVGTIEATTLNIDFIFAGNITANNISANRIDGLAIYQNGAQVLDVNSVIDGGTW
jgi:hypothetical protein